jgi:hypothetical protein
LALSSRSFRSSATIATRETLDALDRAHRE